ncbi:MAG: hypothetical protein GX488_02920, partial [Clostridiales bacterium]|nr:hypothetical protein [Clostridiales bacterium]
MYEQNNFDGENTNNQPEENNSSEYRFSREEIPHRSYMDANYAPRGEGDAAPMTNYTPPVKPPKNKKEKKPGISMAKLICLCLVCAILGGVGGGALVASQIHDNRSTVTENGGNVLNRSYSGDDKSSRQT